MKCEKCGNDLSEKSNFCRICGTPVVKTILDVEKGLEEKRTELTGNIDMSKIVVEKDNYFEDFEDETLDETGDFDKKLEAMKEISRPENVHEPFVEEYNNIDKKDFDINMKTQEKNDTFQQFKIDSMPGEVCDIKLQSTKELEEMIASELKNSLDKDNKFKDTEATMLIPDSLTDLSFKGNATIVEQELKNAEEKEKEIETDFFDDNKKEEVVIESNNEKQNIDDINLNELINSNSKINTVTIEEKKENSKNNKSSKLGYIILTIIVIISLFVTAYLCILYLDSQKEVDSLIKDNKVLSDNNKQNQQVQNMEDSNELFYDGYVFEKNGNTVYQVLNNLIFIEKNGDKFFCTIRKDVSFNDIKNKMESYKSLLEQQGLKVKSYGTKMIGDRSYVVFEVSSSDDQVLLIAYTKVEDSDSIGVIVQSKNNEVDFSKLNNFNEIINLIKKTERVDAPQFNLFKSSINE